MVYYTATQLAPLAEGAFTYGVRFSGRQVGQAGSDFTKQAYVVRHTRR